MKRVQFVLLNNPKIQVSSALRFSEEKKKKIAAKVVSLRKEMEYHDSTIEVWLAKEKVEAKVTLHS